MDEDVSQDPKPIVTFGYLPKDESDIRKPDILDDIIREYNKVKKVPIHFGPNKTILNEDIKQKINEYHKFKEPIEQIKPSSSESKPNVTEQHISEEDEAEEEDDDDDNSQYTPLPLSHVVELLHTKNKSLNSIDIDKSANLLATGSHDGTVKIWDFNALTRRPEPTHVVDVGNNNEYPVVSLSWSCTGGFLLVCCGDCQAKILSRNGNNEISCLKGDSYLHDISNTKGHTFPLTDGKFHPTERSKFITSSRDSTIRIWDLYGKQMGIDLEIMQSTILKAKTFKNHKIPVSSCNYSLDGKIIIGGVNDGSLQLWTNKSWKPEIYIPKAHKGECEITSVLFSNENTFFSRGGDFTMKIWDIRRYEKPLYVWNDLPCFNSKTSIGVSPKGDIVYTGISVKKGTDNSHVKFFSTYDYHLIKDLPVCQSSITALLWNNKINQIFICGSDGLCRCFFDPNLSTKGVMNSIYKKSKVKEDDDMEYAQPIITPLVLPLFDEVTFSRETYLEKIAGNNSSTNKATTEVPLTGQYSKFSRPASVTQHIMQNINKAIYGEGDSQKVLLNFGGKEGMWVDRAYKNTQPKTVLDYSPNLEDEVKFYEQTKKKRCPQCGLKFCTCKKNIFELPISKLSLKKPK